MDVPDEVPEQLSHAIHLRSMDCMVFRQGLLLWVVVELGQSDYPRALFDPASRSMMVRAARWPDSQAACTVP